MSWSPDDLVLVSCADNGSVYQWNMATGGREGEVVDKACSFSYLSLSPCKQHTYTVGSDRTLKQLAPNSVEQQIDLHTTTLSAICLSPGGKVRPSFVSFLLLEICPEF